MSDDNNSKKTQTFYDFNATSIIGEEIPMSTYKGKVVLVVNTASKCGFTPQYEGLQKLYEDHVDNGFVILGFPCNQFKKQEPGTEKEIQRFCKTNYDISFPLFAHAGGHYGSDTTAYADYSYGLNAHHFDFDKMMETPLYNNSNNISPLDFLSAYSSSTRYGD